MQALDVLLRAAVDDAEWPKSPYRRKYRRYNSSATTSLKGMFVTTVSLGLLAPTRSGGLWKWAKHLISVPRLQNMPVALSSSQEEYARRARVKVLVCGAFRCLLRASAASGFPLSWDWREEALSNYLGGPCVSKNRKPSSLDGPKWRLAMREHGKVSKKVRNKSTYNESFVRWGSVTFAFSQEAID